MENRSNLRVQLALACSGGEIFSCPESNHFYDPDFDDERSVIGDGCEVLAASSALSFLVIAFGEERWPVDVETDLAVILEQLPDALSALREGRTASLNFYEQGIERELVFAADGEMVEVRCKSQHPIWNSGGATISMKRSEVIAMLQKLGASFVDFLGIACRDLASHPWLRAWQHKLQSQ